MLLCLLLPVMSTVADLIELLSPATARKTRRHLSYWRILRQKIVSGSSEHLHSYGSRHRPFP
jgi:hypothetical protein